MEKVKWEINAEPLEFYVYKDVTEPCSICGVPACGKESILFYEVDNKKIAFIFDGELFSGILSDYLNKNIKKNNYAELPEFIRQWNECRGWEDYMGSVGFELDISDFLKTLSLINITELGNFQKDAELYISHMQKIARRAISANSKLKIISG